MDMLAVFTTVSSNDEAEVLARAAVERRLAACVQVEAIHSTYRWHGAIASDPEVRLMFKTSQALYPALEAMLKALHPYEVPAVFALPVVQASAEYEAWMEDAIGTGPAE
jgi:periplasmic divalent cation tolerance protein